MTSTPLVIQKYGGSSVATPEQIQAIARRVKKLNASGSKVVIVISAMGSTTDDLSRLAYSVAKVPNRRELDMLLSTGERVASAMMSLALNDLGCPAVSFTGSQAGILTDDSHTNARITDLRPNRIEHEIKNGKIVVLAGFQGVSPITKEITTLGRGGTDLTAVAIAHYFQSARCEILKDVDGVFSADPKLVKSARQLPNLTFDVLQEITFWGAKVLHHRAAELAARSQLQLFVGLAHQDGIGTLIQGNSPMFEEMKVLSVNSHSRVYKIFISGSTHGQCFERFEDFLKTNGLPWPQILDSTHRSDGAVALVTAPIETLEAIQNLGNEKSGVQIVDSQLSSVTATCAGAIGSGLIARLTRAVEAAGLKTQHVLLSPMSATFVVSAKDREKAVQVLHGDL